MSRRRDLFKKLHPVELWIFFGQRGEEMKSRHLNESTHKLERANTKGVMRCPNSKVRSGHGGMKRGSRKVARVV
jgi:hypothetical protein